MGEVKLPAGLDYFSFATLQPNKPRTAIYDSDILYQEWRGEGDDDSDYYEYESRIESVSTDIAYGSIWQYDDEGQMFDDAYDNFSIPLNRLPEKILRDVFHMLYESFKL